ncbi:7TM GPCR serpentine receptor class x (Srx) domain-containing protein [Caenorhabditis elegans]|uniref:7TM GPCR serpentine receptor class x (Srx) domain-containing protein n=1 Tax=Caenorhabditis elegans TaxID=6239 RepID=O17092_CAEEL|nr:7TM GPCR serpentine receptor class x (Srx) domain-containing protein [Caenorhabditis elegans]CCD67494.1 7TM GPCR serpentine receptor class x (Srx) domain-containing protein [Caenorhabditis elegans]|eukprot:NP_494618.2 Serpentine Receptor, class X [Caenorhabditis elegans]
MDTDEIATRLVGAHMLLVSFCGILINFYMFYFFLKLQKTSFYVLCSSKTISNSIILFAYLLYVGPINFFYSGFGSAVLSSYINQAMGYGIYLQGPITQLMITVNRFLVVWISAAKTTSDSTKVTVVALAFSWVFATWFSTLLGLPDNCRVPVDLEHVGYTSSECSVQVIDYLFLAVFLLGVFTNVLNVSIAIKLYLISKSSNLLSSRASKTRNKNRVYLFLQSCFQDWIAVLVILNNILASMYCRSHVCTNLITMGLDVVVYALDGFIMYLFNCKFKPK